MTIYEIEAIDFENEPSFSKRLLAKLMRWRYVWHEDQDSWALHRKVEGIVIEDYFVPLPGQSVKYRIFINEALRSELKTAKRM